MDLDLQLSVHDKFQIGQQMFFFQNLPKEFHIKSKDYQVNMQKLSFHTQNQHIDTTVKECLIPHPTVIIIK